MNRKVNTQTLAWLYDLHERKRLDMDPPYQRRSVWSQSFKDYFIDTVLNDYPCPAIFLFEEISAEGITSYSLVDGKQRLSTLFDFVANRFPVSEVATNKKLHGKIFKELDKGTRQKIWAYNFVIEYIPSSEQPVINNIFDRINRNVARLSRQELRRARFEGEFIRSAEDLTDWMESVLPEKFPRITGQSKRQMKDVEFTAELLLFLEEGVKSFSADDIDDAFAEREDWEDKTTIEAEFRSAVKLIADIVAANQAKELVKTRLRNQADFYSFFAAVAELVRKGRKIVPKKAATNLEKFMSKVEDEKRRGRDKIALAYFDAARSASNDPSPRQTRIDIMRTILQG